MKVKTMEKKGGMPSPLKTSMSTAHGKISWKNQGKWEGDLRANQFLASLHTYLYIIWNLKYYKINFLNYSNSKNT
jgi:hypothetical protein